MNSKAIKQLERYLSKIRKSGWVTTIGNDINKALSRYRRVTHTFATKRTLTINNDLVVTKATNFYTINNNTYANKLSIPIYCKKDYKSRNSRWLLASILESVELIKAGYGNSTDVQIKTTGYDRKIFFSYQKIATIEVYTKDRIEAILIYDDLVSELTDYYIGEILLLTHESQKIADIYNSGFISCSTKAYRNYTLRAKLKLPNDEKTAKSIVSVVKQLDKEDVIYGNTSIFAREIELSDGNGNSRSHAMKKTFAKKTATCYIKNEQILLFLEMSGAKVIKLHKLKHI